MFEYTLMQCLVISIHALRVEGDQVTRKHVLHDKISIHALRVEGDFSMAMCSAGAFTFLSTPSGWRATTIPVRRMVCAVISIHALRVEGDFDFPIFKESYRISIHALRVEGDLQTGVVPVSTV